MKNCKIKQRVLATVLAITIVSSIGAPVMAVDLNAIQQSHMQQYYTYDTEFLNIRKSTGEEYALESEGQLICVDRNDIDLSNSVEVAKWMNNVDIPTEVRNGIKEQYEEYLNNQDLCDSPVIVLFSPSNSSGMLRSAEWTPEYTYTDSNGNKHQMKSYRIYSNGISSEMETVESGANTRNTDIITNGTTIALTAIGVAPLQPAASLAVTLGGGALTLYEAYLFYMDAQVTSGSRHDYVQAAITYDSIHQYTYVKNGETWRFGLQTTWADITDIDFRVYFYNAKTHSGTLLEDEFQSEYGVRCEEIYTPNFNSPYAKTYDLFLQGTQDIEPISIKIGNHTFAID